MKKASSLDVIAIAERLECGEYRLEIVVVDDHSTDRPRLWPPT